MVEQHLTYQEAAKLLAVSARRVGQLVQTGDLERGPKVGKQKSVLKASLAAYLYSQEEKRYGKNQNSMVFLFPIPKKERDFIEQVAPGADPGLFLQLAYKVAMVQAGYTFQSEPEPIESFRLKVDDEPRIEVGRKGKEHEEPEILKPGYDLESCDFCKAEIGPKVTIFHCHFCGSYICKPCLDKPEKSNLSRCNHPRPIQCE